jgi:hypothetical protein
LFAPDVKLVVLPQREFFMVSRTLGISMLALALASGGIAVAQAPQPSLQERVAALKTAFSVSQANLRQYEWIETTVVSMNGEEKSRKRQRHGCRHDGREDGAVE